MHCNVGMTAHASVFPPFILLTWANVQAFALCGCSSGKMVALTSEPIVLVKKVKESENDCGAIAIFPSSKVFDMVDALDVFSIGKCRRSEASIAVRPNFAEDFCSNFCTQTTWAFACGTWIQTKTERAAVVYICDESQLQFFCTEINVYRSRCRIWNMYLCIYNVDNENRWTVVRSHLMNEGWWDIRSKDTHTHEWTINAWMRGFH